MPIVPFLLKYVVFVAAFIFLGYVLGSIFQINGKILGRAGTFSLTVTLGWGILSVVMMILGFSGLLYKSATITVLAIAVLGIFVVKLPSWDLRFINDQKNSIGRTPKSYWAILVGVSVYLAALFVLALYPVTDFDAIQYHLPTARSFLVQRNLAVDPFIRFHPPYMMDLFFSFALMFGDSLCASLTQYIMAVTLTILIYTFYKFFIRREWGGLPALMFICTPVVIFTSTSPSVDASVTLFSFAAFVTMYVGIAHRSLKFTLISFILWGVALGSKNSVLMFFSLSFLFFIIFFGKRIHKLHFITGLIVTLLIALPWYWRNKYYSGDWLFPLFLNDANNKGLWSLGDLRVQIAHFQSFGAGCSYKALFSLPYNLIVHSEKFQANIGIFSIFSIGVMFFIKKMPRLLKVLSGITALYVLIWFYNFQIVRYLFPVLPFLCILSSWLCSEFICQGNKKCIYILAVSILFLGTVSLQKNITTKGWLPVTKMEEFQYISNQIPTYQAINFLNNLGSGNDTVYSLFDEGSVFFHKNRVIGDWFGPARYEGVVPYIHQAAELQKVLKKWNVKYLLISKNGFPPEELAYFLRASEYKVVYDDAKALVLLIVYS